MPFDPLMRTPRRLSSPAWPDFAAVGHPGAVATAGWLAAWWSVHLQVSYCINRQPSSERCVGTRKNKQTKGARAAASRPRPHVCMDENAKKEALRLFTYGLYAVTTGDAGTWNAFTANWLSQVS